MARPVSSFLEQEGGLMIRRVLQTIFAISIVAFIGGCKPAKFVYVAGDIPSGSELGNVPLFNGLVSGFDINATTGALTNIAGSPWASGLGPDERVAVTPSGQFLYVTDADNDAISGYSIDATTGALTPLAGNPFPNGNPTVGIYPHPDGLAVDPSGRFLYVIFPTTPPGVIIGFTIDSTTGAITPISNTPFGTGASGPSAIAVSGNFVYVTQADDASILGFTINTSTGALTQLPGSFPTGNNPVAIAIDPLNGGFAYVTNANDKTVSAYSINATTGALTAVPGGPFNVGSDPDSVAVGIEVQADLDSVADPIDVHSFVYVANSGDNNVSGFSVDSSTGALTRLKGSPFAAGENPDSVTVDPSGHFAYVTNSGSDNVSEFTVDISGILTPVAGSPITVGYVPYAVITTAGP
jgi:6-phosphogluconolactonase